MTDATAGLPKFRPLDMAGALGLLAIVGMMILPLPAWLLSFLLIVNLALSVAVLLLATTVREVLEFSVFPSVLLGLTLFRLALNLASTKLILLTGNPGSVVEAFGKVVVRGDAVVGFVVFLILVVVQFLVITKGSERVSEVAARFTLDAMPGKQMAVDAEMNAGLIDEKQARARREAIQREADFYGAMDGASKFVRGDAMAGLVIVAVNIVGGVVIGMVRRHMDFVDVLRTYTVLTIGDGLAHQIPALVVSTGAGILVTRSATRAPLGREWGRQFAASPRSLGLAAATIGLLGLTGFATGLPVAPFLVVAALMGGVAHTARRASAEEALPGPSSVAAAAKPADSPRSTEDVAALLAVDPLEVELGYGLLGLAAGGKEGDLLERVGHIRRRLAKEMGLVVPPIRIRDSSQLPPNAYAIRIRGSEVARGELMPGQFLAIGGDRKTTVRGVPAREPAFGLPALWISEGERRVAETEGMTVVDNGSALITHLAEVLQDNADEILSRQDLQNLLTDIKTRGHSAVVEELVPGLLPVAGVHRVLQNLLAERVSIRNLPVILEALSEAVGLTKDPDLLTEYARAALARQISQQHRDPDGNLWAVSLAPELERYLLESMARTERGSRLAPDPAVSDEIARGLIQKLTVATGGRERPVVLCSAGLRPYVKTHFDRLVPRLTVLSYNEVTADTQVKSIGAVVSRIPAGVA